MARRVTIGLLVAVIAGCGGYMVRQGLRNRWVLGSIGFQREVAYTLQAPDPLDVARYRDADPLGLKLSVGKVAANQERVQAQRTWAVANPEADRARQAARQRRDEARIAAMQKQWSPEFRKLTKAGATSADPRVEQHQLDAHGRRGR